MIHRLSDETATVVYSSTDRPSCILILMRCRNCIIRILFIHLVANIAASAKSCISHITLTPLAVGADANRKDSVESISGFERFLGRPRPSSAVTLPADRYVCAHALSSLAISSEGCMFSIASVITSF